VQADLRLCRNFKSDQPPLQEIKMNQQEKIRNALKLAEKLDQLETRLWNRYYNQFLEVLSEEDIEDRPLDTQTVIWPF
jgi:hypothetical protein